VKKLLILLVLIGAALAAGAYWLNHGHNNANPDEGYTFATVEYGMLTETVSANGPVRPTEVVPVGSELSGRVVEIFPNAEVNKVVREGEPLLQLDDRMARIQLSEAKTTVRLAQFDVSKAENLRDAAQTKVDKLRRLVDKDQVGFQKDLEEANYQLRAAQDAVSEAKLNVERAKEKQQEAEYGLELLTIRVPRVAARSANTSPSELPQYTVLEKKVVPGQLIAPPASGQLLVLASDPMHMKVEAMVSENDISKIRRGQETTFTVYAYSESEAQFHGKVSEIRPMPTTMHTAVFYPTIIDVVNQRDPQSQQWRLLPGMNAAVNIILRKHPHAWKMPTAALSFQPEDSQLTDVARNKLAAWQKRSDTDDWRPVWTLDPQHQLMPIFVRLGGVNSDKQTGIQEGQYTEVLEWDPDLMPKPQAGKPDTYPKVVTAAPAAGHKGLFEGKTIKLF
jgi:HlyD family secretion protein